MRVLRFGEFMNINKKQLAGEKAAEFVKDGMTVGIGTGSTIFYVMQVLKRRMDEEGLLFVAVPSSFPTKLICEQMGFNIKNLADCDRLDIAFDGADRIDAMLNAIKGGGAAQTAEKVFASMADTFVLVADESKYAQILGSTSAVPVETLPYAWKRVKYILAQMGYESELRNADCKDGLVITDNGNYVLDIFLHGDEDLELLNKEITMIPGVLEVGVFVGMADVACIGTENGVRVIYKN